MAAIIIPFFPVYEEEKPAPAYIGHLINAAWIFSRCALWPQRLFPEEEVNAVQDYIRTYFNAAEDKERAFTALCERVVLAQKYLCRSIYNEQSLPSVWFSLEYPFGYAGTLAWLSWVEHRRKEYPQYLAHIKALASGYYDYITMPTERRFARCEKTLLSYNADHLLDLFYSATILLHHQRA